MTVEQKKSVKATPLIKKSINFGAEYVCFAYYFVPKRILINQIILTIHLSS